MFSHAQCYKQDQGVPNTNPFTWAVSGRMYTALAVQAAGASSCPARFRCCRAAAAVQGNLVVQTLLKHSYWAQTGLDVP